MTLRYVAHEVAANAHAQSKIKVSAKLLEAFDKDRISKV